MLPFCAHQGQKGKNKIAEKNMQALWVVPLSNSCQKKVTREHVLAQSMSQRTMILKKMNGMTKKTSLRFQMTRDRTSLHLKMNIRTLETYLKELMSFLESIELLNCQIFINVHSVLVLFLIDSKL